MFMGRSGENMPFKSGRPCAIIYRKETQLCLKEGDGRMEELQLIRALEDDLTLAAVADNLDAGVAIYDAQGNFVFVNTVMINWRNIPRNEYLKKNVHDFTQFIDVCVYDLVCQKKQRVSRLQYYQDIQKVNSPTRMRIVTGTPIFDGDGNIKYVVTMLQDVQSFQSL